MTPHTEQVLPALESSPSVPSALKRTARNLDRSLAHGVAWTASAQWLSQGMSWAATVIVAQALTPDDYGLVAMAVVVTGLIEMVSDLGMGTAVVKHHELTKDQIAQINGLCILLGIAGWGICCLAAYPLSRVFGAPALVGVVVVGGMGFFITAFRSVPLSLMQRDLQFRDIAMNQAVQAVVLSVAMVMFAVVFGLKYWSLVLGTVLGALLSTLLAVRLRPTAIAWPRARDLRGILSFGRDIVMMRISNYVTTSSDFFVTGKMLGQSMVGGYSLGMTVAGTLSEKVSGMAMRVLPPIISAVQSDFKQLKRYILGFTECVSLLTVPAGIGLALVASDFVHMSLGDKWIVAIVPLQILSLSTAHRSTLTILPNVAAMVGLSRVAMQLAIGIAACMPIVFFVGSHWGIAGVAYGWLLVYPFLTLPYYIVVFRRTGTTAGEYFSAMWPALSSSAVMAVMVYSAHHLLYPQRAVAVRLAADALVGMVSYLACLATFHRSRMVALKNIYTTLRSR